MQAEHDKLECGSHDDICNLAKSTSSEADVKATNIVHPNIDVITSEDLGNMVNVGVDDVRVKMEEPDDDTPLPVTNSLPVDSAVNCKIRNFFN